MTRAHQRQRARRATSAMLIILLASHCLHAFPSFSPHIKSPVNFQFIKTRRWSRIAVHRDKSAPIIDDHLDSQESPPLQSRRLLLQGVGMAALTSAPLVAHAGKAELDQKTGELFSPKAEMIRGGSDAARGIRQQSRPGIIQPGQTVQTVYEPRFITYLTRFLLTFDPPSHAWWLKQGFQESWEQELSIDADTDRTMEEARFAEFAESVEVGLADYFTGPYGSYASVSAAKAGINAAAPARAAQVPEDQSFLDMLLPSTPKRRKSENEVLQMSKQGILNLYALLKARYTSVSAKRQLAILFSLISSPKLQPVNEIRSLLGEADNATITKIVFDPGTAVGDEAKSRTSCRRGGGYSVDDPPKVNIDAPPALGDKFPGPVAIAKMKPTSRILKINVIDGGAGYDSPPAVFIRQRGFRRLCEACAILDREGHVESVIVLDPGYGYGLRSRAPPEVIIDPPRKDGKERRSQGDGSVPSEHRRAKAVSKLEYNIIGIDLIDGGNGYSGSERPSISISPPKEYPEWYYSSDELFGGELSKQTNTIKGPTAQVVEMRLADGTKLSEAIQSTSIDAATVNLLKRDPLELLPTTVRPEQSSIPGDNILGIPGLPPMPPQTVVPSARYRAYDPLFGGLGTVPVTMGALELSASEYSRIALGGAVCTVIVRTLLNPLELVKTKVQLKNDKELNDYAYKIARANTKSKDNQSSSKASGNASPSGGGLRKIEPVASNGTTAIALQESETMTLPRQAVEERETSVELGTMDVIKSIVELRGPLALFQSADITFLASIVFGSFGFGATELFRRSFTAEFMSETTSGSDSTTSTLVLLAAAAVACVITSAAATPFEVLRVRSMGLVEAKPWKEVFVDYVVRYLLHLLLIVWNNVLIVLFITLGKE